MLLPKYKTVRKLPESEAKDFRLVTPLRIRLKASPYTLGAILAEFEDSNVELSAESSGPEEAEEALVRRICYYFSNLTREQNAASSNMNEKDAHDLRILTHYLSQRNGKRHVA